ncbi:MAG: 1,2-phenylacetyl-CoA epoxidase subunit PaaC, partial [Pseudomonadales bacterium]
MSRASVVPVSVEFGQSERFRYVLRLADTSLILGQRLGEWVGHAPALEEDLGVANISLDLIGQARLLLSYAGEIEAAGRDEDQLAYLRDQNDFCNLALVEQPNGDFGCTIVRQVLIDVWQLELLSWFDASTDQRLREIAAKAVKETRYHLRYSSGWLVRLGDGTEESHTRVQTSLNDLWKFTTELFTPDEIDRLAENAGVVQPAQTYYPHHQSPYDTYCDSCSPSRRHPRRKAFVIRMVSDAPSFHQGSEGQKARYQ